MKQHILCTLAACAALSAIFAAEAADSPYDAARNKDNQPVITKMGSCVRTKWDGKNDVCAPKKEPKVAEPAPVKATVQKIQMSQEQRTVYFDFNKASLTDEAKGKLDALVAAVKGNSEVQKVSVLGYTDTIGSDGYNQKLSEKRAAAVNSYLSSRISIPTQVLTIRGEGKSKTADCPAKMARKERIECLKQDRKVEVDFVYKK